MAGVVIAKTYHHYSNCDGVNGWFLRQCRGHHRQTSSQFLKTQHDRCPRCSSGTRRLSYSRHAKIGRSLLAGAGLNVTKLQLGFSSGFQFGPVSETLWNHAPQGVHSVGDTMEYRVRFPRSGVWGDVWLRYATDMALHGATPV